MKRKEIRNSTPGTQERKESAALSNPAPEGKRRNEKCRQSKDAFLWGLQEVMCSYEDCMLGSSSRGGIP